MLVQPRIQDGIQVRGALPGDVLAGGEGVAGGALTTVGAGTITGAMIASGIVVRSGPVGGFTDTTDTASNIIKALTNSNSPVNPNAVPGTTFRLLYINTVAQAMTFAAGEGVVAGTGGSGVNNVAASLWREYLVTLDNVTPRVSLMCTNGNASKTITFDTPQPMGTVTPGMWMSGANITSGTRVVGLTLDGSGKISGVTTDTNSTGANATSTALVFSPQVTITGLRSGTA